MRKSIIKQRGVFTSYKNDSELTFMLCESMVENEKPFVEGEFIKNCLTIFANYACPEREHLVEFASLSRFFVSPRANDL